MNHKRLTIKEIVRITNTCERRVNVWLDSRRLRSTGSGSDRLVTVRALQEFLTRHPHGLTGSTVMSSELGE